MGGLISLYALFPAAVSVRRRRRHEPVDLVRRPRDPRVRPARADDHAAGSIVDVGTSEGAGTLRDARTLNRVLRRKGYKGDALWYLEAQGAQHREEDWAWRLPQALEFLLRER